MVPSRMTCRRVRRRAASPGSRCTSRPPSRARRSASTRGSLDGVIATRNLEDDPAPTRAGRRPTAAAWRPTRRRGRQPDRLPRAARPARPLRRGDRHRPLRGRDDRRLPGRRLAGRADSSHGQGDRRRRGCRRAVLRGPAARGRPPGRRRRPGPAAGDDLGGRGGALVPLPRLPARAGHRLVGGRPTPRSTGWPATTAPACGCSPGPRCTAAGSADPWWRDAVPALTRVTRARGRRTPTAGRSWRRSSRCRSTCAGWSARVEALGGTLTRMALPGAARPRRGGGQRDRPRRPADGRRPVGAAGARPGRVRRAGRPRAVVARRRRPDRTSCRARSDIVVGGTDDEGEWDRRPDPDVGRGDPGPGRRAGARAAPAPGCSATGSGCARRVPPVRLEAEQPAGRRVVHCYGHGGAGVTLSWGCADEVAGAGPDAAG